MIKILAEVGGRKTLVIALNDEDLTGLLDGRHLLTDVTGQLGAAPLRQIMITAGEVAVDVNPVA